MIFLKTNIVYKNINEIKPYENNPRINDDAVDKVAASIQEFGIKQPFVVDDQNVIIVGHTRHKACLSLGITEVPCIVASDLTPEQVKAYRLADNKTNEFAEWDFDLLQSELDALLDFDMTEFGFDEITDVWDKDPDATGSIVEKFIVPPFSVLDSKQGYWKDRKTEWKAIINSGNGRDDELLGKGFANLAKRQGKGNTTLTGTSIFDPVLCEVLVRWFCPAGGSVIDPFAGGSVRGLVSAMIGNDYTGVDLSSKQIQANYDNYNELQSMTDFNGNPLKKPNWINGDSANIDKLVESDNFDFLLTCPPYADLEVYSDDPADISNMPYDQFKQVYFEIIKKTVAKLKENAFSAIVVGDVRDKNGYYHNFVGDTKDAFIEAGCKLYNECILVESGATAALRVGKQFNAGRKVVKTHQNVFIFIKGDEKKIDLKPYDYELDIDE